MWLNRVFRDLAKPDEWHCLTIDCSGVNKNGPGRYRTQADDPEKQVCYFNKPRDNELYNVFISNRIKTENFSNSINFKVDQVQGKDETFDAEKTLKQDSVHDRFSKFDTDSQSLMEEVEHKKLLSTFMEELGGSQLDQVSFRIKKKQRNTATIK